GRGRGGPDPDRHGQRRRERRLFGKCPAALQEWGQERELAPHRTVGRAMVVTVSDRGFAGEMEDASGPAVAGVLEREGFDVATYEMLPDNRERIIDTLLGAAGQGYDLVVTTGGTGLGPRDITPQATQAVIDYEVPGLAE